MRTTNQKFLTVLTVLFATFFATTTYAQLTIDAQLRPRLEYRHGYKTLFPDNTDAATFVSQRTRLNTGFKMKKLNFYLSLQDVRVWGDVGQLNSSDKNGFAIHQAWGEVLFSPSFAFKAGRQELVYDDHRIFGSVGWAQQARSHDAALLRFNKNKFKADMGYAFNQNGEALSGHVLTGKTYKSLFYTWLHNDWESFGASLLFLHNGLQFIDDEEAAKDETRYSQMVGSHLKFKKGKFGVSSNLYYQFGKDVGDNDLSAYLIGLDANYKISDAVTAGLGGEIQSGNDMGGPSNGENKAFTPLYGTNHKFNGHMDYFYVGNHGNNVGLVDLFAKAKFAFNSKNKLSFAAHHFMAAADISGTDSKTLGTEIDLAYTYAFSKEVKFQAGYSQMFASEGLEIVKGNIDDNTNNWAWLMVTINPTLFKTEVKKEE